MNTRTRLATLVGRTTQSVLRKISNGGTSLPGKLATKIDPNILSELSKEYEVIIITGTNGKTVTTALTTNVLRQQFDHVLTNETGSNMIQGVISSFIQDSKNKTKHGQKKVAVLEVDEASVRHVTEHIKPAAILTTNVFRDQVDRYSDIEMTYDLILEGAAKTPESVLLMNGDAPIFNESTTPNPRQFFGFANENKSTTKSHADKSEPNNCPNCGELLTYEMLTYSNLGDYTCPNCGLHRPELTYLVDEVLETTPNSTHFVIDGHPFVLPLAGIYNVYNALSAYAIGRFMDIDPGKIAQGLMATEAVFGRQERIMMDDKELIVNLIKNAAGLNQMIELLALEEDPFALILSVNNNPADGIDSSWLKEGHFEQLLNMPVTEAYVSGSQQDLLTEQLVESDFGRENIWPVEDEKAMLKTIKGIKTDKIYILASYTAMLRLREELAEQGFVKERMQA